jgi:chromosome segregation ATPase
MNSLNKIEKKVVGKTVVAIIEGKKHTLTLEADPKKKLVDLIDRYNKKPSKTNFDKIFKQFNAKAEKTKELALIEKKVKKRTLKEAEQELKQANQQIKLLSTSVEDLKKLNENQQLQLNELIKKTEEAQNKIKESRTSFQEPRRGEY